MFKRSRLESYGTGEATGSVNYPKAVDRAGRSTSEMLRPRTGATLAVSAGA